MSGFVEIVVRRPDTTVVWRSMCRLAGPLPELIVYADGGLRLPGVEMTVRPPFSIQFVPEPAKERS